MGMRASDISEIARLAMPGNDCREAGWRESPEVQKMERCDSGACGDAENQSKKL
jgi:hypothetical protein